MDSWDNASTCPLVECLHLPAAHIHLVPTCYLAPTSIVVGTLHAHVVEEMVRVPQLGHSVACSAAACHGASLEAAPRALLAS
jgi:hypothetical protein